MPAGRNDVRRGQSIDVLHQRDLAIHHVGTFLGTLRSSAFELPMLLLPLLASVESVPPPSIARRASTASAEPKKKHSAEPTGIAPDSRSVAVGIGAPQAKELWIPKGRAVHPHDQNLLTFGTSQACHLPSLAATPDAIAQRLIVKEMLLESLLNR